jgi:hypothetical protein
LLIDKIEQCIAFLNKNIENGQVDARVTAYFGYFVGVALWKSVSLVAAKKFLIKFYTRIVGSRDTIFEKTADHASLAHGWSVGFVSILLFEE